MNSKKDVMLSVMTWNIYQGADLSSIFTSSSKPIPELVTEVFRQFLATNFPKRAKAIARQIELEKPDIIGLQEAVLVEFISPDLHRVVYDFINILLDELEDRDIKYELIVKNKNTSIELPTSTGNKVAFTDRDVILVRKDSDVKVVWKQGVNFQAKLPPIQVGNLSVTITRGWSAMDAILKGHMFRMVTTHLEPLSSVISPFIQESQGNELLAGPGQTDLPLIFTGDFNSKADNTGTATYRNLINAGFTDTWLTGDYGDGFTCCQDGDLLNAVSTLSERIDLILMKNNSNWEVIKEKLVGEAQSDRTRTRLWPSDHAGVVAKFRLGSR